MASKMEKKKQGYSLANIKVIGIGGGGGNIVSRMSADFAKGVEFLVVNTDHQDLDHSRVRRKIYIGRNLTRGLGTGMNPELGRQAAEENRSEIAEGLRGADLIFIAAGLGGGTGTGAAPVVAEAAKQSGALTIAFVTKPFAFEGSQRDRIAQEGLLKLKDKVDALIVVPNDRIFTIVSRETPIIKAFAAIDAVLKNALKGIVDLIVTPGIINVDFADIKNVVQDSGSAIVGLGIAAGQERAVTAVNQALNSPLLETSPEGAKGIVLGISGRDLKMNEINEAAKLVAQAADPGARIIFGAYYDRRLRPNQFKVTLIATGFNGSAQPNSLFSGGRSAGASRPKFLDETDLERNDFRTDFMRTEKETERSESGNLLPKSESREKEKVPPKPEAKKKDSSDVWDIPTFLRKRRK